MKSPFSLGPVPTLVLGASALVAQTSPLRTAATSTALPVARIYVTHYNLLTAPNTPEIVAYDADSSGRLTPVPGGPWPGIVDGTTGTYLFANDFNQQNVMSYEVDSTGALRKVANYNLTNRAPAGCENREAFQDFTLDHTGATLYATGTGYTGEGDCITNVVTQSYKINKADGDLTYLGEISDSSLNLLSTPSFAGNNLLAFAGTVKGITAFQRESNGMLVEGLSTVPQPIGAPAGMTYWVYNTAADPDGHLAIYLFPEQQSGSAVLAAYTTHSNGDATTTNTFDEMPVIIPNVFYGGGSFSMQMSPSGKLLAVSNSGGLRVYHFNGANPITLYATLAGDSDNITNVAWDNSNHLYATGSGGNKLYVFTVTGTGYSQAPGSPYTLTDPQNIVVRSITPP